MQKQKQQQQLQYQPERYKNLKDGRGESHTLRGLLPSCYQTLEI